MTNPQYKMEIYLKKKKIPSTRGNMKRHLKKNMGSVSVTAIIH